MARCLPGQWRENEMTEKNCFSYFKLSQGKKQVRRGNTMNKLECPYFDSCNAPLCPLDEEGLKKAIWYPDEEICKRRGLNYSWLKVQKKIGRRAKHGGYFTFEMITHSCRISQGITGLDPDKEEGPQLEKWLRNRSPKRGLRGVSKPCSKGGFMAQNRALRGGFKEV